MLSHLFIRPGCISQSHLSHLYLSLISIAYITERPDGRLYLWRPDGRLRLVRPDGRTHLWRPDGRLYLRAPGWARVSLTPGWAI